MKLPDFKRCVEFRRLLEQMGITSIPILPPVEFTLEITKQIEIEVPNTEAIELEEQLTTGAISVDAADVDTDYLNRLTYKGRKVVAYIRDQRTGIDHYRKYSYYRYHLCDCSTLRSMRAEGREKRYLVTKRDDGLFEVHDTSYYRTRKMVLRLDLCYNCKKELDRYGMHFSPFSLKKFFQRHDSQVPKTIQRIETVTEIQTYAPNHDDIAREYKKAAKYTCQLCGVDCSSNPSLLHLHHCNGIPSDNTHDNLRVLCIDCHSKQPQHSQLAQPQRAQEEIRQVRVARKEQGITQLHSTNVYS